MDKKTILISGITGFLGSRIGALLLEKKHQVVGIKQSASKTCRINPFIDKIHLCTLDEISELNHRFDCVIHTATKRGNSNDEIDQANILFSSQLLNFARAKLIPHFINFDTSLPASLNHHAHSKKIFLKWAKKNCGNVKIINLKTELIYGYDPHSLLFPMQVIEKLIANESPIQLTQGNQRRDFIHIDDAVEAVFTIISNLNRLTKPFQQFDLGNGTAVSIRAFVELAAKHAQSTSILNFGAIPLRSNEPTHLEANPEPLKALDWRPKYSLESGIRDTIDQYLRRRTK